MESVFEIIDQTNDEMYWPLAVFPTLKDAKEAISDWPNDDHISEFNYEDEFEVIHIVERKLGWSGAGRVVYKLERITTYNEEEDEYYWTTTKSEDVVATKVASSSDKTAG